MERLTAFLQKWRVRLGHLFAVAVLVFARPEPALLAAGTVVALAGELIRIAAAGCIREDTVLSRSGPYGFTRNPLYVGSFLMYLGFCIAAGNIVVLAIYFPFFFIVYYATIMREESYLRGAFGAEFESYCADVPRFFPRLRPAPGGGDAGFSVSQTVKNKEYEGMIAVVVILALLWVMGMTGFRIIN